MARRSGRRPRPSPSWKDRASQHGGRSAASRATRQLRSRAPRTTPSGSLSTCAATSWKRRTPF
eukprot:75173-Lingulodinium_polyedra.AAC.1